MRIRLGKVSRGGLPAVMTRDHGRKVALVITLLTLVFVLVGGFFTVQGIREWIAASASAAWPTVPGTITHSEVTRHTSTSNGRTRTSHSAKIEFDYTVAGTTHHGRRLTYRVTSSSQAGAQAWVDRFPVGATVAVSVDPDDPEHAVLEPGWDWSNLIPIAIGLFAMVFALLVRWFVIRAVRKAITSMERVQALGGHEGSIQSADGTPAPGGAAPPDRTAAAGATPELKPAYHDDLPGQR